MSNETLSYLGYEDLSDFTSQHSDFANLLVNKEGYIYKFQNFSWIDFILYSGSPNKSALLQLKSGDPLEIKLSVKEVHLVNELGHNSKFYSIRILSDNFVNIASKTDASITKQSPPKNAFNLNNLIPDDAPASDAPTPKTVAQESEEKSDFVLNFPSSESLTKEEAPVKLDLSEPKEDSFVLSMPSEEAKPSEDDFKLNLSESMFDTTEENETPQQEDQNFTLNFLKEEESPEIPQEQSVTPTLHHEVQEEVKLDFLKPTEPEEVAVFENTPSSGFKLKHTEEAPLVKEEKEEKITLNFLKQESTPEVQEESKSEEFKLNVPEEKELKTPAEEVNLNFLKQEEAPQEETTQAPANKEQIIAQIQNDIKEIDEVEEENTFSFNRYKEETKEATTPPEQPKEVLADESVEADLDAYLFNKNEVKKEKKSFTKTLQSLFSESSSLTPQESKEDEYVEVFQEPAAVMKKEEAPISLLQKSEDTYRFPTLSSLGLDKEEEDDLISEFVNDTKANITLFKDFYKSGSIDQAEYTLIKMQSSANILNLNDIIITLANVKQSCTDNNPESIEQLTATLENQVSTLESYLESETV